MKTEKLMRLFEMHKCTDLIWEGQCADCKTDVVIHASLTPDGQATIEGGAIYSMPAANFYKCDDCYAKDKVLRHFQECEVYSRVVGYLRPFKQWNPGKQTEFNGRKMYKLEKEAA